MTPTSPDGKSGPWRDEPAFSSPPISNGNEAHGERVVAGEGRDDDPRVAERGRLEPARAAVERVREVAYLARAAETSDRHPTAPSRRGSFAAVRMPA